MYVFMYGVRQHECDRPYTDRVYTDRVYHTRIAVRRVLGSPLCLVNLRGGALKTLLGTPTSKRVLGGCGGYAGMLISTVTDIVVGCLLTIVSLLVLLILLDASV